MLASLTAPQWPAEGSGSGVARGEDRGDVIAPLPTAALWKPLRGRTLMRSPVVKRQTIPQSGFLAFFPLAWCRHSQHAVVYSGFISVSGRRLDVSAPNTYGGSTAVEMTIAERLCPVLCDLETYRCPHAVLLNREAARFPCASECQVRGRGSTHQLSVTLAAYTGAGVGVQSIAQGQDKVPMCSWAFADAGRHHCRALSPGSSYGDPVRPQARLLPSLHCGGTSPYRRPSLV
jgi:hypothetical protein